MLGVRAPAARGSDLLTGTWEILRAIGTARIAPLAITLLVIVAAMLTPRVNPKLPAPLLGLVAALAAARFFGLHASVVAASHLNLPPPAAISRTPHTLRTILSPVLRR